MTKKKETASKAKAAEDAKETKAKVAQPKNETKPETKKDVESKDDSVASPDASESIISTQSTKDTSEEKESLKSPENTSGGMSYEDAEKAMNAGQVVALPEWGGFWFKSIDDQEKTYVLTKEGKIVDTPQDEFKERNDWKVVEPTDEQSELLEKFWNKQQVKIDNEASKQREEYESLKAVAHAGSKTGNFHKLKKKISISDLEERKNLPDDVQQESVFLMDNGFVFDLLSGQLTNREEQEILKQIK